MADIVDTATRSRMMSKIRGKHTKPEMELRRALHALGLRYRVHVRSLPGTPDIVLPKWHAVVLVHGCFWHRHAGCSYATTPATRPEFWQSKFKGTVDRDRRNESLLLDAGWRIAFVWECSLRRNGATEIAAQIVDWLSGPETTATFP